MKKLALFVVGCGLCVAIPALIETHRAGAAPAVQPPVAVAALPS